MSEYSAPVQFIDLAAQQPKFATRLMPRLRACWTMVSILWVLRSSSLKQDLKDFTGARHALTCANGTDALTLVMMAWGVGPGDAVFVPSFTYVASAETPAQLGATPFFVDVLEKVSILTLQALRKPLAKQKVRVCVLLWLFRWICLVSRRMSTQLQKLPMSNIKVLVDGAQSFGAIQPWAARRYDGRCNNNQFLSG